MVSARIVGITSFYRADTKKQAGSRKPIGEAARIFHLRTHFFCNAAEIFPKERATTLLVMNTKLFRGTLSTAFSAVPSVALILGSGAIAVRGQSALDAF